MSPAGTSEVSSLLISPGATLDLTNNGLVVEYSGASPLATIAGQIAAGYHGGDWLGSGITSSAAAAVAADATNPHKTAIGYAEASALGISSFQGQPVDGSAVVVGYVLAGDANLDGTVNAADFNVLAANFNTATPNGWAEGDFNDDGVVNAMDFAALAANYGLELFSPSAGASLGAVVPEPGLLSFAAAILLRSPRRKPSSVAEFESLIRNSPEYDPCAHVLYAAWCSSHFKDEPQAGSRRRR